MEITWLSTASILIKNHNTSILFDPYLKSYNKKERLLFDDILKQVDAVFITHPHFDHFSDIQYIIENSHSPIYVCQKGIDIARKLNLDLNRFHVIDDKQTLIIRHIEVHTYQGCHCVFDKKIIMTTLKRALQFKNLKKALKIEKLNRFYKIDKTNDVFCYEVIIKKKKIFIMGSANLRKDINYPENMDILIYPYQGRSDMDIYSMAMFQKLKPKIIILDHFDDAFPPISTEEDCEKLIQIIKSKMPKIKIIKPKKMKSIELKD